MLNAKPEYAEREGETIAGAGRPGAVTIATNMAGRGVDIKLGGNPEQLTRNELAKLGLKPGDPDYDERFAQVLPSLEARVEDAREEVLEAGGLYIVGTERHESRRIDNQLRGRSGRQGDPGESRFFLSAEDDLVRLFAGDRIYRILDRLGPTTEEGEEEPIEAKMLSKQIENAQRKVEEQNYLIRKRVLEYDDVMNQQREIVYKYRDEVLEGRDMGDRRARADRRGDRPHSSTSTRPATTSRTGTSTACGRSSTRSSTSTSATRSSTASRSTARSSSACSSRTRTSSTTSARPSSARSSRARSSATCCCRSSTSAGASTSTTWTTCARASTSAASPRSTRSSPTRTRASALFQDLMNTIWSDFARMIFNVEVEVEGENGNAAAPAAPAHTAGNATFSYSGGTLDDQPSAYGGDGYGVEEEEEAQPAFVEQRRLDENEQIGRNDPCWCGSGKKFKKCHGA